MEAKVDIVQEDCLTCQMPFWVTREFLAIKRKNHERFYCPNGHNMYFPTKTDEEKLRDRLLEKENIITRQAIEINELKAKKKRKPRTKP